MGREKPTYGLHGFSGYSGMSGAGGGGGGISGYSGFSGIDGTSGYSGLEGVSGYSGLTGNANLPPHDIGYLFNDGTGNLLWQMILSGLISDRQVIFSDNGVLSGSNDFTYELNDPLLTAKKLLLSWSGSTGMNEDFDTPAPYLLDISATRSGCIPFVAPWEETYYLGALVGARIRTTSTSTYPTNPHFALQLQCSTSDAVASENTDFPWTSAIYLMSYANNSTSMVNKGLEMLVRNTDCYKDPSDRVPTVTGIDIDAIASSSERADCISDVTGIYVAVGGSVDPWEIESLVMTLDNIIGIKVRSTVESKISSYGGTVDVGTLKGIDVSNFLSLDEDVGGGDGALTVDETYGIYIGQTTGVFPVSPTLTDWYGIYITDQTQMIDGNTSNPISNPATNIYNFYSAGVNSFNLFEGRIFSKEGKTIYDTYIGLAGNCFQGQSILTGIGSGNHTDFISNFFTGQLISISQEDYITNHGVLIGSLNVVHYDQTAGPYVPGYVIATQAQAVTIKMPLSGGTIGGILCLSEGVAWHGGDINNAYIYGISIQTSIGSIDANSSGTLYGIESFLAIFNIGPPYTTIADGYHIYIHAPTAAVTANNLIDKLVGLYIEDQTVTGVTTLNANIYSAGANSKNIFEGKLWVGSNIPLHSDLSLISLVYGGTSNFSNDFDALYMDVACDDDELIFYGTNVRVSSINHSDNQIGHGFETIIENGTGNFSNSIISTTLKASDGGTSDSYGHALTFWLNLQTENSSTLDISNELNVCRLDLSGYHPSGSTIQFVDATLLRIASPIFSGPGSFSASNIYGIYIEDQGSFATNNYNIYSAGANSRNVFKGTIEDATFKNYSETLNNLGDSTGLVEIDFSSGQVITVTILGDTTFSVINPPPGSKAGSFTLILVDGGSANITWMSGTQWPGGTPPTLTVSGIDVLTFFTIDGGTTWVGVLSLADIQ